MGERSRGGPGETRARVTNQRAHIIDLAVPFRHGKAVSTIAASAMKDAIGQQKQSMPSGADRLSRAVSQRAPMLGCAVKGDGEVRRGPPT